MFVQKRDPLPVFRIRLPGLSEQGMARRIGIRAEQIGKQPRNLPCGHAGKRELPSPGKPDVKNRLRGTEPDAADFQKLRAGVVFAQPVPKRRARLLRTGADGAARHAKIQNGMTRMVMPELRRKRLIFGRHGLALDAAVRQRCQKKRGKMSAFRTHCTVPPSRSLSFLHSSRTASSFFSESIPA